MAAGERVRSRIRPSAWWVLGTLMLAYALLLSYLSLLRHADFRTGAYDLGIFDQALWLISRGQEPWIEFRGLHILGDHAALALYLLAPLYWVWPDARALLVLQSLLLASGALPVYLLARQQAAGSGEALVFACAYLIHPVLANMNLFDFHPEALAVPALLWSGCAAQAERPRSCLAACALAVACKFVVALPVAIWGGLLWWRRRRPAYLIMAAASLGWFVLAACYLVPALSGAPMAALQRYERWGGDYAGILWGAGTHAGELLRVMWWRIDYAVALLLPAAFLPLAAPAALLPALPIFVLNAISDRELQHTVFLQYNAAILPFLWLAAIAGFGRLRRAAAPYRRAALAVLLACAALGFHIYAWQGYFQWTWQRLAGGRPPAEVAAARRAVALVPPQASVLSDQRLLPHLTHRLRLRMAADYLFPTPLRDDYVVLDLNNFMGKHLLSYEVERQLIAFCRGSPAFDTLLAEGQIFVFRRRLDAPVPTFMYHTAFRLPPGPVPY